MKVIKHRNLPSQIPFWQCCTGYLMLERFNAPEWTFGAMGLLAFIFCVIAIIKRINEERIDLFENPSKEANKTP